MRKRNSSCCSLTLAGQAVHWDPIIIKVEVMELWTVFHEHYSLLVQSGNMSCCISTDPRFAYWVQLMSENLSEGIFWISCLSFELYSFYCVHTSTTSTVENVFLKGLGFSLKVYIRNPFEIVTESANSSHRKLISVFCMSCNSCWRCRFCRHQQSHAKDSTWWYDH